jgi:hypothetical protein
MKTLLATDDYTVNQTDNCLIISLTNPIRKNFLDTGLRIAFTISDCVYSLKDLAYTEDLKNYHQICMDGNNYIGLSFLLSYLKIPEQEKLGKGVDRLMYEMLDFLANRYYKLWELIKFAYPKIKKDTVDCHNSAEELFLKIVEYERKKSFEVMIETSYFEYSPSKMAEYSEQASQGLNSNVSMTYPDNSNNPLIAVISAINNITKKGKNDKLKYRGEEYNLALKYYWNAVKKFTEARTNKGMAHKSISFKDGVIKNNSYKHKPQN